MRARWRWAGILLALLLPPLVLRGCLFEAYAVESSSMEPAFRQGDRLVVLQRGADPHELRRWDVLVLDSDIDAEAGASVDAVLKRVVGLPGEWLRIEGGDAWVGDRPESLRPARKPPKLVQSLLVPLHAADGLAAPWTWVGPGPREDLPAGGTRLTGGSSAGVAVFEARLDDGLAGQPGETPVADTAVEVVVGEGSGSLELRVKEGADIFKARLGVGPIGGALLYHNLTGSTGVVAQAPAFRGLRPGARVLMYNVDDSVRVLVDGDVLLSYDYNGNEILTAGSERRNEPEIAVLDGYLVVRHVTVLRDLHYTAQGAFATDPASGLSPYRVPAGHVFILGDHSRRSRDSRFYGAVPLDEVLGRPLAVYGPWDRARWLTPAE